MNFESGINGQWNKHYKFIRLPLRGILKRFKMDTDDVAESIFAILRLACIPLCAIFVGMETHSVVGGFATGFLIFSWITK